MPSKIPSTNPITAIAIITGTIATTSSRIVGIRLTTLDRMGPMVAFKSTTMMFTSFYNSSQNTVIVTTLTTMHIKVFCV
jgi:hypothetical protein